VRTLACVARTILSRVGAHAEVVEQIVAACEPRATCEHGEARVPEAASLAVSPVRGARALGERSGLGVRVPGREVSQESLAPGELAREVVRVADREPVEGARVALLAEQVEAGDGAALVAAGARGFVEPPDQGAWRAHEARRGVGEIVEDRVGPEQRGGSPGERSVRGVSSSGRTERPAGVTSKERSRYSA
jgi:hypothetical protein